MKQTEQIEHKGIIKNIQAGKLEVSIVAMSACASCNLKGACSVSDTEEKIVDVYVNNSEQYKHGEEVTVFYKRSLGFRALFLGYLLPFLILLFTLIISISVTQNELMSGILSIAILIPYYIILYLVKDKIKQTFRFSIERSNQSMSFNLA